MPVSHRGADFLRIYRVFITAYLIFCTAMTAVYASKGDIYHTLISAGTLAAPPAITVMYRLMRLKRSPRLDMLIMGFTTLAYPLGACIDLYRRIPGFDKLAHALSGVFVAALSIILFIQLRSGRMLTAADVPLAVVFAFFGSMAVAGLWEIGEYIISGIVRLDLQRVRDTGVSDSMNDMIVCLLGTLAALPAVPRLANGKNGMLISPIREFCSLNMS